MIARNVSLFCLFLSLFSMLGRRMKRTPSKTYDFGNTKEGEQARRPSIQLVFLFFCHPFHHQEWQGTTQFFFSFVSHSQISNATVGRDRNRGKRTGGAMQVIAEAADQLIHTHARTHAPRLLQRRQGSPSPQPLFLDIGQQNKNSCPSSWRNATFDRLLLWQLSAKDGGE
jgi:hypothetical protein